MTVDWRQIRRARRMINNQHLAEELSKKELCGSVAAFKLQLLAIYSNLEANSAVQPLSMAISPRKEALGGK